MDEHQTNSSETCVESLPAPLSEFFKSLTSTEACCNKCKRKFKFSTKASSNLITHLKRCSPNLCPEYVNLKRKHQENTKKV